MDDTKTIGLIAGGGRLPFLIAQGAKEAGLKVICAGLGDNPEPGLIKEVDFYTQVPLARPGAWIRKLKKQGVTNTIMVGKVRKEKLFTPMRILKYLPDWRAIRIYYWRLRKNNKVDQTILQAIADELASGGIILQDSTKYCKEHLADKGVMTKTKPSAGVQEDIDFGWQMLKKIAETGIGQAVAVKEKTVLAVEAVEGTGAMIERAGQLCKRGNWTLLKAPRPDLDMRFDVPCVGPETIESLHKNGGRSLVVEAGRTIIIDKPQTIELADRLSIAIIGC
ncbi:MAG: UDP-2,3-diacylglucosamine diphosphatase LpxI [Phycisphaerales bacterium]